MTTGLGNEQLTAQQHALVENVNAAAIYLACEKGEWRVIAGHSIVFCGTYSGEMDATQRKLLNRACAQLDYIESKMEGSEDPEAAEPLHRQFEALIRSLAGSLLTDDD